MDSRIELSPGDLLRFELPGSGLWFYCRAEETGDPDRVVCIPVDAQSWPDAMLGGIVPGRQYALPRAAILSVVRKGA